MTPIQESGYEADYGYDAGGEWDAWDQRQHPHRQQQQQPNGNWDLRGQQQQQQQPYVNGGMGGYVDGGGVPNAAGVAGANTAVAGRYDPYVDEMATARPQVNYSGRTVHNGGGMMAPIASADWPVPTYAAGGNNAMTAAATATATAAQVMGGVAGITTPPRHSRKLPQIPKPAEITQKLQLQKQQQQMHLVSNIQSIG